MDVDKTHYGQEWTGVELSRTGLVNANHTYAHAINSDNSIAGYYDTGGTVQKALRWNGSPTALSGYWSTSDLTYGNGINDNYIMVGTIDKYEGGGWGTTIRPFQWHMFAGTTTILNPLTSGGETHGKAINLAGTTVGYGKNSIGVFRALRWNAGQTTSVNLNTLNGDAAQRSSVAYAINKAGFIVGQSQNVSLVNHAFVVPPGKLINLDGIDLGTIGGAAGESEAFSINDFNQIVGASQDGGVDFKPFITTPNQSTPTAIPPIFGQSSGNANGINNSGVVVGDSGGKAFIWQEGYSYALDLNNFKPSALSHLDLQCAEAINHNGVIVGWGEDGSGNTRAFMLSPE